MKYSTSSILCLVILWRPLALASSLQRASTSAGRLPLSLSSVVTDLERQGHTEVSTVCLLTSRSVLRRKQAQLLRELAGDNNNNESTTDNDSNELKVLGTLGLAIGRPDEQEVIATSRACDGNIIFYADPIDLCRGEGLFDQLAPVMEQLVTTKTNRDEETNTKRSSVLTVIIEYGDLKKGRATFEQTAELFIANLAVNTDSSASRRITVLSDIFDQVEFVSSPTEAIQRMNTRATKYTPLQIMDRLVRPSVSLSINNNNNLLSSFTRDDFAAARVLGPRARAAAERAVQRVQDAGRDENGHPVPVAAFGALVDTTVDRALESVSDDSLVSSTGGQQIRANLVAGVCTELWPVFVEQLAALETVSFEDFRKSLSRLLVSPNLKTDMDAVVRQSVSAFGKSALELIPQRHAATASWKQLLGPAKQRYSKRLHDFCATRLLAARASGQYKPLPRKGITVGLHYLLPKPFGNDFRQEPWLVHATDSMVYIPKDKITDINPNDVAVGDWRDKIVPSPVGNDMIYMQ